MKSLQTIQKTFRVFQILAKISGAAIRIMCSGLSSF